VFKSAMTPILNPATIQEYLNFSLFGFALLRFWGCWIGFKAASEAVDSSASVEVDPQSAGQNIPTQRFRHAAGRRESPLVASWNRLWLGARATA
jgi:indolepyruvate ferredoxin oxidoreductase